MARRNQPGILIVDRSVHGPYENYRTPEQQVPGSVLPYPWETCMTMAGGWSYSFNPNYKSSGQLVRTLVDVVARAAIFCSMSGLDRMENWIPQHMGDYMILATGWP
ncbi:MAG: alpha-L-fucosidase [Lewinellaceae bacterium]|nr:alpha-L-fucosidase [Lewinellaceae bacterium]